MRHVFSKIQDSFNAQQFMQYLGAEIIHANSGYVRIACNFKASLGQQNGFFHAGVLASIADSACGYAAMSCMDLDSDVLSVEFKINMLKPAVADRIIASAKVIRSGKTITVCDAEVTDESGEVVFAKMMATMIQVKRDPNAF